MAELFVWESSYRPSEKRLEEVMKDIQKRGYKNLGIFLGSRSCVIVYTDSPETVEQIKFEG